MANLFAVNDSDSPARSPVVFHPELQAIVDKVNLERLPEEPVDVGERLG